MARKRKEHTAAFKAQVALAALKGDRTANELAFASTGSLTIEEHAIALVPAQPGVNAFGEGSPEMAK